MATLVLVRHARSTANVSGVLTGRQPGVHLDETGRDLLSVTADNKPGEYEVFYAAEFSVTNGAAELIAPTQVRLTRNYGYDESAVLAKEHEEASLRLALAVEIAELILRRLAAL